MSRCAMGSWHQPWPCWRTLRVCVGRRVRACRPRGNVDTLRRRLRCLPAPALAVLVLGATR